MPGDIKAKQHVQKVMLIKVYLGFILVKEIKKPLANELRLSKVGALSVVRGKLIPSHM